MPILVAIPIVIGLIIYGAVRLYARIAGQFGWFAGITAVALAVAIAVLAILACIRRYQRIHGKSVHGERTLALSGPWGVFSVDANQKRGELKLDGHDISFIFADIGDAAIGSEGGRPTLLIELAHAPQPQWRIPMETAREARRWQKIVRLAAEQKL